MEKNTHEVMNHAWKYFELHANQRISLIRFYIGAYSLYVTASGYLLFKDPDITSSDKAITFLLSIFILTITLIFYVLDNRNRDLIHLAEDSLRQYEIELGLKNPHNIFVREQVDAEKNSKFRHSHCFNMLFLMGSIGALLILFYVLLVVSANLPPV